MKTPEGQTRAAAEARTPHLQTSKFYRYDTSTSRCSLCNSRPAAITALAVVLLLLNLPVNRWTLLLLTLPLLYTRITILINLVILPQLFIRTTPSLLLVSYGLTQELSSSECLHKLKPCLLLILHKKLRSTPMQLTKVYCASNTNTRVRRWCWLAK